MTEPTREHIPRVIVANNHLPKILDALLDIRKALDGITDRLNKETDR